MATFLEFFGANAALMIALLALVISLRANYTAHQAHVLNIKNKSDSDRILLSEKKRELLNEVDRQYAKIGTLQFLTGQKILLFRDNPSLHSSMDAEFRRLKLNLNSLSELADRYEVQRQGIEAIGDGDDISSQVTLLAEIQRLTIHLEKDIEHERAMLARIEAKLQNV